LLGIQQFRMILRHAPVDVAAERRQRTLANQRLIHLVLHPFAVLAMA
jgi:hypothetical protein